MKKVLFMALIAFVSIPSFAQESVEENYVTKELAEAIKDYYLVSYIGDNLWEYSKEYFKHDGVSSSYIEEVDYTDKKVYHKWGVIDSKGQVITPCVYTSISSLSDGLICVGYGKGYGFIDKNGREVIKCSLPECKNFKEGLGLAWFCLVNEEGIPNEDKYGYINKKGEVVIPVGKYEDCLQYPNEPAIRLYKEGNFGLIGKDGKVLLPCTYDYIDAISDGLVRVIKGNIYYYFDLNGNMVISISDCQSMGDFHEGLATIKKDGLKGYIDKTGSIVIPTKYLGAGDFSDGLALVTNGSGLSGFIDYSGKEIIPCIYDEEYDISAFKNGVAIVVKDDKSGLIDKTGKMIFLPQKYEISYFYTDCAKIEKNSLYGLINKMGEIITPCVYNRIEHFNEGIAVIYKKGEGYGYVDVTGKIISPCIYESAYDFHEGMAKVKKDKKYGYIDKTGKIVIPCIYDYIDKFYNGLAIVEKDEASGLIDKTGKCTLDYK